MPRRIAVELEPRPVDRLTEPGETVPRTEPGLTVPRTASLVTVPPTEPGETVPRTESGLTVPRTESGLTVPRTASRVTVGATDEIDRSPVLRDEEVDVPERRVTSAPLGVAVIRLLPVLRRRLGDSLDDRRPVVVLMKRGVLEDERELLLGAITRGAERDELRVGVLVMRPLDPSEREGVERRGAVELPLGRVTRGAVPLDLELLMNRGALDDRPDGVVTRGELDRPVVDGDDRRGDELDRKLELVRGVERMNVGASDDRLDRLLLLVLGAITRGELERLEFE